MCRHTRRWAVKVPSSGYRGDGIERVLDGEKEDLVSAVGVVGVGRPGDSLGRRVIKVGLLACRADGGV